MPKNMQSQKGLEYYLSLPYTSEVKRIEEDGKTYYWAKIKEMDGCHTSGDTWKEAYEELQKVFKDHIEIKLEHGDSIPEPVDQDYSGKFIVRIPKSLHKRLSINAEEEGVSLNQYVLYKLSK